MSANARPMFRSLTIEEIHELLERNHVGRMAYSKGNSVDIEPLHYVYSEGWLYGRTSRGTRLRKTGESWWPVAFQVDEIDGLFEWKSVVVHGGFYTLSPSGPEWEVDAWGRGVELLRTLVPETFTTDDPTPFRSVIFRIAVQEISGRAATIGSGSRAAGEDPNEMQAAHA